MSIIKNRPLCGLCIVFIIISAMCTILSGNYKICLAVLCTVTAVILIFIAKQRKNKSRKRENIKRTAAYSAAILLTAFVAISESFLYYNIYAGNVTKYYKEADFETLVISRIRSGEFYTVYEVEIRGVDGKSTSVKGILECEYRSDLSAGSLCLIHGTGTDFDNPDEGYSEKRDMTSEGIFLKIVSDSEDGITVLDEGVVTHTIFLRGIRDRITRIFDGMIGGNAGVLFSALVIGDRSRLDGTLKLDFSRAGISHLLALSGLHMTVIFGGIGLILRKCRIHRRVRGIILAAAALAYLALTGFSPSASRAVFMLIMVYASWLGRAVNDKLTGLTFAGAFILLVSPNTVMSQGFWLSCFAALGIIVMKPLIIRGSSDITAKLNNHRYIRKCILLLYNPIAVSICALWFVMCFNYLWFGELSLMSAVSMIVLIIPFTVLLVSGLLFLLFFWFPPAEFLLAWIVRFTSGILISYSESVSDIEGVMVSLRYPLIGIVVIIATVVTAVILLSRIRQEWLLAVIPTAFILIAVIISVNKYLPSEPSTAYIRTSSLSEGLIMTDRSECVIADLSTANSKLIYDMVGEAKSKYATELQTLIITSYNAKTPSAFTSICTKIKTRRIWIPEPVSINDYYIMKNLIGKADEYGVEVTVYRDDDILHIFDTTQITVCRANIERSARSILLMTVKDENGKLTVAGPALNESMLYDRAVNEISDSDAVLFMSFGPVVKTVYDYKYKDNSPVIFADEIRAAYCRTGDGNINMYISGYIHDVYQPKMKD